MREEDLKTSPKQRAIIATIAILMLTSVIVGYALVIAGKGNSNSNSDSQYSISSEKAAEYEMAYTAKTAEFKEASATEYGTFSEYLSNVKAYNETSANEADLTTADLKIGDGRELTSDDTNYLAFYVGWCADEKVFSSSLDDSNNPTGFRSVLNVAESDTEMIEGWRVGVVGMHLGGVRIITIPSELAYGDSEGAENICGANKPLKFLIMAVANEEPLATASSELNLAYQKALYAQNGIDYDKLLEAYTSGE